MTKKRKAKMKNPLKREVFEGRRPSAFKPDELHAPGLTEHAELVLEAFKSSLSDLFKWRLLVETDRGFFEPGSCIFAGIKDAELMLKYPPLKPKRKVHLIRVYVLNHHGVLVKRGDLGIHLSKQDEFFPSYSARLSE